MDADAGPCLTTAGPARVIDRHGAVNLYSPATGSYTKIATIPVSTNYTDGERGEDGLLGLAEGIEDPRPAIGEGVDLVPQQHEQARRGGKRDEEPDLHRHAHAGEHLAVELEHVLPAARLERGAAGLHVEAALDELLPGDAIEELGDPAVCQGTLISRFSYNIDVNEWSFRDLRKEATIATRQLPIIHEITASDVWDENPGGKEH